MFVSKSEFARLAGVSRGAVTNAVPRGLLIETADGKIDTDSPLALRYLADHAHDRKPEPKPVKRKAAQHPVPRPSPKLSPKHKLSPGMVGGDMLQIGSARLTASAGSASAGSTFDPTAVVGLKDKRIVVDIELKRTMRRKHELDIATKKGQLIPRELVVQELASFDAALKMNFRDLPRRASAQLHAIALAEGPRGLEAALEREIGAALERAKMGEA